MNSVDQTSPIIPANPEKSTRRGMFVLGNGTNVTFTFFLLVSLFTLWGFCTGMIDTMDKHFQDELHLTLEQSAWVQTAHYLGYFLMALPAGWMATRLGYKNGIIFGLLMVAAGAFWFIPATHIFGTFLAVLLGICVLAAGLTFLETIANPYTTVLGPPQFGATRINLAQSCNGIGLIFGPIVGAKFFYSKNAAGVSTGSEQLWIPYAGIGIIGLVLVVVFYFANVPEIKAEDDYHVDDPTLGISHSIWVQPHFLLAVVAQFLYVAAQAGIFSFFINYMTSQVPAVPATWEQSFTHSPRFLQGWLTGWFEPHTNGSLGISNRGAANLFSVGLFLFVVGRFTGSALLKVFTAHFVLGIYCVANTLLCALVFLKLGWLSVASVFLIFFFMSIMFPTVFALGIYGLGQGAKQASSLIVMAIVGGAVLPKLMGKIADHYDLSRGFIMPLCCFGFMALYAFLWPKLSKSGGVRGLSAAGGH